MPLQLPPGLIPPRQATPRNFDRATWGGHAAAVAATLGRPFIPWQRYAADVALEVDDAGQFVYGTVIITVQRQAGKTALDLATGVQNCLMGPSRRIWYTAQSGQHAADKWLEMAEDFNASPLKPLASTRLTNGSQHLKFVNKSTLRPHPPTADSLHSKQSDRNTVDEAWAFSAVEGAALQQAIVPTTTTRQMATGIRPQQWILSTEGTVESTWLNPLLDRARAGDPTICFIDFGIGPDVDPTDLDAVAAAHPGFGYLFGMPELVDFASKLPPGEFGRAFGNRRTGATERVIPAEPWAAAKLATKLAPGPVCFGAAVGMDGVDTSIVAAQRKGNTIIVEVIEHHPGTSWGVGRLQELTEKHKAPAAIDRIGPSAALYDAAERAGIPLVPLTSSTVSAACQNVLAGITADGTPTWRYRPGKFSQALDDAAELATRRWISDGAWVWGRRASVGSISALEAATHASWGIDHLPKVTGIQLF